MTCGGNVILALAALLLVLGCSMDAVKGSDMGRERRAAPAKKAKTTAAPTGTSCATTDFRALHGCCNISLPLDFPPGVVSKCAKNNAGYSEDWIKYTMVNKFFYPENDTVLDTDHIAAVNATLLPNACFLDCAFKEMGFYLTNDPGDEQGPLFFNKSAITEHVRSNLQKDNIFTEFEEQYMQNAVPMMLYSCRHYFLMTYGYRDQPMPMNITGLPLRTVTSGSNKNGKGKQRECNNMALSLVQCMRYHELLGFCHRFGNHEVEPTSECHYDHPVTRQWQDTCMYFYTRLLELVNREWWPLHRRRRDVTTPSRDVTSPPTIPLPGLQELTNFVQRSLQTLRGKH